MAELIPRDEFDDRLEQDAKEALETEEVLAYMLFNKPQLDALVLILRKAERSSKDGGDPRWTGRVSELLDQAQSVQANYERNIQPEDEITLGGAE